MCEEKDKDAIGCVYFVLSIKSLNLVSNFGFLFVKMLWWSFWRWDKSKMSVVKCKNIHKRAIWYHKWFTSSVWFMCITRWQKMIIFEMLCERLMVHAIVMTTLWFCLCLTKCQIIPRNKQPAFYFFLLSASNTVNASYCIKMPFNHWGNCIMHIISIHQLGIFCCWQRTWSPL